MNKLTQESLERAIEQASGRPSGLNNNEGNEKNYADIRVKLGNKKSPQRYEVESLPSDIGDDMWGEIPRYQHFKY